MRKGKQELLVVGDRILVEPEEGETTTEVGLILPATAVEKESVQSGKVVAMGPGTPLPPPTDDSDEPWKQPGQSARFMPMQVKHGDIAVFFRKAAIEITFQKTRFLVVPHSAILVLVRDGVAEAADGIPDTLPEDL